MEKKTENERAIGGCLKSFTKGVGRGVKKSQGDVNEMLIKDRQSLILFLLHHPYSINAGNPRPGTTDTTQCVTPPWC